MELPSNLGDNEIIMKLLDENEMELKESCSEFTRLSFTIRMLQL